MVNEGRLRLRRFLFRKDDPATLQTPAHRYTHPREPDPRWDMLHICLPRLFENQDRGSERTFPANDTKHRLLLHYLRRDITQAQINARIVGTA